MVEGFKDDIRFVKTSKRSRSYTVECAICGRHGAGAPGGWIGVENWRLYGWQYECSKPHTFECACGKFFPKSQALGAHVAANRRHRIDGHGRMDRVGL